MLQCSDAGRSLPARLQLRGSGFPLGRMCRLPPGCRGLAKAVYLRQRVSRSEGLPPLSCSGQSLRVAQQEIAGGRPASFLSAGIASVGSGRARRRARPDPTDAIPALRNEAGRPLRSLVAQRVRIGRCKKAGAILRSVRTVPVGTQLSPGLCIRAEDGASFREESPSLEAADAPEDFDPHPSTVAFLTVERVKAIRFRTPEGASLG